MKRYWATVAVLLAFPALANAQDTPVTDSGPDTGMANMLIGQDAFGNWQDNKPGVWRKFGAGDLPQPYASKSASNAPGLVERPADAVPEVAPGFTAALVASGLSGPRDMALAPNGDIFVADSTANQIVVLRMAGGKAKPAAQSVFASSGLDQPYGIAFYPHDNPKWVYVGNTGSVVRFPYHDGDIKASGAAKTVIGDLPTGGHWTRDIVFSSDDFDPLRRRRLGLEHRLRGDRAAARRHRRLGQFPTARRDVGGGEGTRRGACLRSRRLQPAHRGDRSAQLLGPGDRADGRQPVVRGQRARRPRRQRAVRLCHARARGQFLRLAVVLHRRQ